MTSDFPRISTREEKDEFVTDYVRRFGCRAAQRARDGYAARGRGAVGHWIGDSLAGPGVGFSVQAAYWDSARLGEVFEEAGGSVLEDALSTYDPTTEALLFFSWPDAELEVGVIDLHASCPTCGGTES
jgi:hypothetical protein